VPRFMVESYPVGFTPAELAAASERASELSAELKVDGIDVRLVGSTLVPGEESLFCIFEAPSREVVEQVVSRSGIPMARVSEVVDVGPRGAHH